jgi:hypothetical protein
VLEVTFGQIRKWAACVGALVAGLAFLSACGSGQDGQASASMKQARPPAGPQGPAHSIQRCLSEHGARQAGNVVELNFLAKAEEEDDVSKPGMVYDKAASIVVHVWTGSSFEGHPAPWMVWIGQPFGKDRTPQEIVAEKPKKSYVMYVRTAKKRKSAESCITFGDSDGAHTTEVNLSGQ